MAASTLTTPDGNAAGRVTITATLVSLIPPLLGVVVLIACYLVGIFDAETAATAVLAVLAVLAVSGITSGTVFTAAKRTPTDQYATVERVVPVAAPDPVAKDAAAVEAELPEPEGRHAAPVIHDAGGEA